MSKKNVITELLGANGIKIQCPNCEETFSPGKAKLFDVRSPIPEYVANILNELEEIHSERLEEIKKKRKILRSESKSKPIRIKNTTQSVNFGQIIEKIIPAFNNFPYDPKDCRSLFEPIDYIVFSGLNKSKIIEAIKFVEVKSGNARLNSNQKNIQEAVNNGKIEVTVI